MSDLEISKAYNIVGRLSDESLAVLTMAAADELAMRRLQLPKAVGAFVTSAANNQGAELINPLDAAELFPPTILAEGRLVINYENRQVKIDDKIRRVQNKRFDTLAVLAANTGRIIEREYLLKTVWNEEAHTHLDSKDPTVKIDTVMHYLRATLGKDDLGHPVRGLIRTQPKLGWILLHSCS